MVVVLLLLLLLFSLRGLANFWTDYLWFDSVDFAPVWSTLLFTKIVLAVIGIVVAFGLILGNLWLAQRVGPELAPPGPGEQLVLRYRSWAGSRRRLVVLGVSGFFGLVLGLGAGLVEDWLLFANQQSFGVHRPRVLQRHRVLRVPGALPAGPARLVLPVRRGDAGRGGRLLLPEREHPGAPPAGCGWLPGSRCTCRCCWRCWPC